jgi:hypothetical protein
MQESAFVFAFKNLTHEGIITFSSLTLMSLMAWSVIEDAPSGSSAGRHFYDACGLRWIAELVGNDDEFEGAPTGLRLRLREPSACGRSSVAGKTTARLLPAGKAPPPGAIERGMSEES